MQKELPGRAPMSRIMGEGGRGSRAETSEIMGFPRPCWFQSLGEADQQPPELCLRTPRLRDPGSGAPRPAGRARLGRAGWPRPWAPVARPPAPGSVWWRRSAPCRCRARDARPEARGAPVLGAGGMGNLLQTGRVALPGLVGSSPKPRESGHPVSLLPPRPAGYVPSVPSGGRVPSQAGPWWAGIALPWPLRVTLSVFLFCFLFFPPRRRMATSK